MQDAGKLSLWMSIAALMLSIVALVVGQLNRLADRHQQEQDAQADLHYVDGSFKIEKGNTILTFENKATRIAAAVTGLTLSVSDPEVLRALEAVVPKPRGGPYAMGANESNEAVFRDGHWAGDNFEFDCRGGYNIKAGDVGDIRLKIISKTWTGDEFVGDLTVNYNGPNSPYRLGRVTVPASAR